MGRDRGNPDAPSYVGADAFMHAPRGDPETLDAAVDVAVVGVPFDGGASRQPGARYGPEAIRRASGWYSDAMGKQVFNAGTGRSLDFDRVEMRDCGDVPVVTTDVEATGEHIREAVQRIAGTAFPVILGGDHSLTYPAFTGFAAAHDESVGLLHLDAHSDVYGESEKHGTHWHGSPMNLIDESPYGSHANHAVVGLRAYEDEDFPAYVEENGMHVSYARDVHERGVDACIRDAISHATEGVDRVYCTVDIDVVEPTAAPGTGTPEFGGLSPRQFLTALDLLGQCDAVGALDLVEVAPRLDPTRKTQRLAAASIARFLEPRFLA